MLVELMTPLYAGTTRVLFEYAEINMNRVCSHLFVSGGLRTRIKRTQIISMSISAYSKRSR